MRYAMGEEISLNPSFPKGYGDEPVASQKREDLQ